MRFTIITGVVFLIWTCCSYSQTFSNYYANSGGGSVQTSISLANGTSVNLCSPGLYPVILFVDTSGDILLTRKYGYSLFTITQGFSLSKWDSTYIMLNTGFANPSTEAQILFSKLNIDGSVLWTKRIDFDSTAEQSQAMVPLDNGRIVIAGSGYHTNHFLLTADVNGNFLWHYKYIDSISGTSYTQDLVAHSDNSVTVLDYVNIAGKPTIALYKLDSLGNVLWSKRYENNDYKMPISIAKDSSGFMIFGTYSFDNATFYPFALRTDLSGNQLWLKVYQDSIPPASIVTSQLIDNTYILSGRNSSVNFQYRIDNNGNILWARSMRWEYGCAAIAENTNDYVVCTGGYLPAIGIPAWVSRLHRDSLAFCSSNQFFPNVIQPSLSAINSIVTKTPLVFTSPTTVINSLIINSTITNVACDTILSIQDPESTKFFEVSPNPFNSFTTVKFQKSLNNGKLDIYNEYGVLIKTVKNINGDDILLKSSEFNTSNGVFFLILKQDNEPIETAKIILIDQ